MAVPLSKRPVTPFWGSKAYFKDSSWGIHNFLLSGQRIGSHILWLISSFKQRDLGEILVGFQGRWTSIYYVLDSQIFDEVLDIFPRLSYRLTFIMLNIGDGRQPRILVDNFLIPRSKHVLHSRVSRGRICEDNIEDHKRKVDTNRLVSETHQIWKDLLPLDSPNVHLQYEKKIKEIRQISAVNGIRYSLNTDNLGWN